ncbi:hypothetical protein PFISCL1PPCAC_17876, partial [Pristionchus fissidentatus]
FLHTSSHSFLARRPSMGSTWLPILLLAFCCIQSAHSQIERTMRHWRHREEGVCSGSSNMRAQLGTADRFNDLRLIYQNCTRVFGNVEITHLDFKTLGNQTIDFLDDIEEVKGYIFIYSVKLKHISFKNLKIIWGDTLIGDKAALYVEGSPLLEVLSMPNLRSIANGEVGATKAENFCHFKKTVNFNEILDFNAANRTQLPFTRTCISRPKPVCHPSCNGHCWGPEATDCQSMYRSICPDYCESKQCFFDSADNQTRCCHSQCVGGCTGSTAKDCIACTNFMQCNGNDKNAPGHECKCVEQCTSMKKYNQKTGQVEKNPDGFYSLDNRHCEKECPINRLYQDDVCVEHCGEGMHYDPNKGDKICRKCDGPCPKSCKFEKELDAHSIHELKNCTEIEGFISIRRELFTSHFVYGGDVGMENMPGPNVTALTLAELNVLRTVRFVSEYVYVAADDAPMESLDFLENLEVIEGRNLFSGRQALVISKNDNLISLGLRKLKKIEKGDVIITNNVELCMVDTINWSEIVIGANSTFTLKRNRDKDTCKTENKFCHIACDPAAGCWGKADVDCRKCNNWRQDGKCVDKCNKRGFYENSDNQTCERCYVECDTCKGPEATDCLTCRGFKLFKKPGHSSLEFEEEPVEPKPVSHLVGSETTIGFENTLPPSELPSHLTQLTCVPECPSDRYYVSNGECKRCHRSCYDLGCNGPSNVPGVDGCKACKYAQIELHDGQDSKSANVTRCLYNSDKAHSNAVCTNNDLLDHFVQASRLEIVHELLCVPCDKECLTCTGRGNSRLKDGCVCRNYVGLGYFHKFNGVNDEKCIGQCGNGMYRDESTTIANVAGVCRQCHPSCDKTAVGATCTGSTPNDCTKCTHEYFTYEKGENNRTCLTNCSDYPGVHLFTYYKDRTCHLEDKETREKIRNGLLWSIGILFLLTVLIIGCLLWRRQRRLSKELEQEKVANALELPELIPMDLANNRPNMERLTLIPKHALSRSGKELGRGAFGVVYAGCWMPKTGSVKSTKVPVAIKVVRDPSGRAQAEMLDEATKMTMLRHENLLRIVGVCLSGDDLQLVTLLRPLGNLREFLQKHKGKLSGKELLQYSYQIASGMKYLTDHRVVHRDLAARNVLVKNIHHVEITDFGLAKLIDIGSDSVQVGEGKVAIKWLALEALEKQVYNTATDMWAFGVTVWEVLTYGESPYASKSPHAIKEMLLNGERLGQPNNCSVELYKVLIDCWLPNPDSRPTFALVKDLLYRYCRAPHMFVYDIERNGPSTDLDNCSQRGLIEDILDETDFEDPQNYFDSEPNTPGCVNTGDMFNPMGVRRMDSLGSQRYAQDPVANRKEIGIVDDNYLVPNSQTAEIGATLYTPVVVDETGNSSLVESLGYYNEVKPGAEYINDVQTIKKPIRNSRDDRLSMIEEDDSNIEKESCL